jgi:hypothetical protein
MAKLEVVSYRVHTRDRRGFGYRVHVMYAQPIGYRYGAPDRNAYIEISHYVTNDGRVVFVANAYDTAQFERWPANVFPPATSKLGQLSCTAKGASPVDLLVSAGMLKCMAEQVVKDWEASGPIKPTGTSSYMYEAEWGYFVPSAGPTTTSIKEPAAKQESDAGDAPVLARIRAALEEYHLALDRREHGSVAAHTLINKLQNELNMPWVQGAAPKRAQPVHAQLVHVYAPPTSIKETAFWWRAPTLDEMKDQLTPWARSHLR